jgi:cytochrome c-type biogenesis protein CcmH
MLQYVLTVLAGIAIGAVAMRVWNLRDRQAAPAQGQDAPRDESTAAAPHPRFASMQSKLLLAAAAVTLAAVVILMAKSAPGEPAVAAASAAPGGAAGQQLGDVDSMIAQLAARLEKEPNDGEGHRMLGWSYVMTGHPDKAIAPYKRALELLPNSAIVHSGYGEALVGVAGNTVTPDAKAQFDQALALDKSEPRARYFLGLWKSQNGQEKQALEDWITLANGGPADAPWQGELRAAIAKLSAKLGVDSANRLKPASAAAADTMPALGASTIEAANAMPAGDRDQMIAGMVDGLAAKLKADPRNLDGWLRLIRSRVVLNQQAQAKADLATARGALASDKAALQQLDALARELNL